MGYPENHPYHSQPAQGYAASKPLLGAGSETTLAMACHLSTFLGVSLLPVIGWLAGPLIVWLTQKDRSALIDHHGREAINFQLSLMIWYFVAGMLCFVFIGFFILPVLFLFQVIMTVIAGIRAAAGEYYRYPLTFRFI